ncbi:hypothetical protein FKM82_010672 [Ascaphus truei]
MCLYQDGHLAISGDVLPVSAIFAPDVIGGGCLLALSPRHRGFFFRCCTHVFPWPDAPPSCLSCVPWPSCLVSFPTRARTIR